MTRNEYEIIEHTKLSDIKLFLVDLAYRNPHMHQDFELCLVLSEAIEVYTQRKTYLFSKGDLVLFNPKQPHEIKRVDRRPSRILSLQMSPRFCERYFPLIRFVEFDQNDLSQVLDHDMRGLIESDLLDLAKLYFTAGDCFELKAYAALNNMLYNLIRSVPWHALSDQEKINKTNTSKRLSRILEYIEVHYAEKVLLSDIAKLENLSLSYLSHTFKENLNMTFQEYVASRRFEQACYLLEKTAMNITDISLACGFSDRRYMAVVFQKKLDCSPKDYRHQISQRLDRPASKSISSSQHILSMKESLEYMDSIQTYEQ